jgi:hypothetical protein|tara:strand:- start:606 stop:1682 length:1077 start_codon:yes stop_codon:yes gene_type:complete
MPKQGGIQLSAPSGDTGGFIATETFLTGTGLGLSSGAGATQMEVQVVKLAWGSTGEFYWVDDSVAAGATTGSGNGPIPIQMRDSSGSAVSTTAISSSTSRMIDVNIRNQGGSAASLLIYGPGATATIAVAGTSGGHYVPIAGSTAGGAIPHVGATTDSSVTGGYGTSAQAIATTGGFAGTVSEKLRRMTSDLHSIKVGGTGADGTYRIGGLSADIRSVNGWTGSAKGSTVLIEATGGMTAAIAAIAGGVTIGIGSISVDNPVVMGSSTAGTGGAYAGSGGIQLRTGSTVLQSGVRVKNTHGSGTLTVSYDSVAGSTSAMTGGWNLDDREEVFVEVDNLNKVYVRGTIDAGINYSYYAT